MRTFNFNDDFYKGYRPQTGPPPSMSAEQWESYKQYVHSVRDQNGHEEFPPESKAADYVENVERFYPDQLKWKQCHPNVKISIQPEGLYDLRIKLVVFEVPEVYSEQFTRKELEDATGLVLPQKNDPSLLNVLTKAYHKLCDIAILPYPLEELE